MSDNKLAVIYKRIPVTKGDYIKNRELYSTRSQTIIESSTSLRDTYNGVLAELHQGFFLPQEVTKVIEISHSVLKCSS